MVSFRRVVDDKLDFVVVDIELPFSLRSNAVVDLETTGLDEEVSEIVSYGVCLDSYCMVVCRAYGSHAMIKRLARTHVGILLDMGYTVWAWYKVFEENFLGYEFKGRLRELQKEPYEKKDRALSWGMLPPIDGKSVPELWMKWVRERDVNALKLIIQRNMYDIMIEAASLARHKYLELITRVIK